jgi:hypothetical protein
MKEYMQRNRDEFESVREDIEAENQSDSSKEKDDQ